MLPGQWVSGSLDILSLKLICSLYISFGVGINEFPYLIKEATGHEGFGNSSIRGSLKFFLRLTSCSGPFTHRYRRSFPEGAAWRLMLRSEPSHIFCYRWAPFIDANTFLLLLLELVKLLDTISLRAVSWWYMHMRLLFLQRLSAPHDMRVFHYSFL